MIHSINSDSDSDSLQCLCLKNSLSQPPCMSGSRVPLSLSLTRNKYLTRIIQSVSFSLVYSLYLWESMYFVGIFEKCETPKS